MSQSAIAAFDHTLQTTNIWLRDLTERMGWQDRHRAYYALRAVLHVLRDRLPVDEVAALAAQLPMLVRGFFYEGWHPSGKPLKLRKKADFLAAVGIELGDASALEAESAVRGVFYVLAKHVAKGEIRDVKQLLPRALHSLWPDECYGEQRRRMVVNQLQARGIKDPLVLQAMEEVPREEFVAPALRQEAYGDYPLPIGLGQTISQPYTVAYLLESLQLRGDETVLEIGTGSGYQAAVLSRLVPTVHTVERIPQLAEQAEKRLERLECKNVHVYVADGSLGLPQKAPFDAIVVTACAEKLPEVYADQLAEGGRIVIPIGPHPHFQKLCRFTLRFGSMEREELGSFAFVPLIGEHGWKEELQPA